MKEMYFCVRLFLPLDTHALYAVKKTRKKCAYCLERPFTPKSDIYSQARTFFHEIVLVLVAHFGRYQL